MTAHESLDWIWNIGLPAVLTVAAWLVARRSVITKGVQLAFRAVESMYPSGSKPAGLTKTEAAFGQLTQLLNTYWWLPGLTQKEMVRVKTTWEAMHAVSKPQRPALVLREGLAAYDDFRAARAAAEAPAPAVPATTATPAPATVDLQALALQVQALLPPPAPAVDHDALVRAVLARLSSLAGASDSPRADEAL